MNYKPELTEAQVKRAISDRLELAQNQGQLFFARLNSGDFIEVRGKTRRRIRGCQKGTADFVIFQGSAERCLVTFIECKSSKGRQTPEQEAFEQEIIKQNCRYFIVRDADKLEEILA